MSEDLDPGQLLERTADETILEDDGAALPESMGRPPMIPVTRGQARIVTVGATLTGVTLFGGIALTVLGAIDGISGGFGALALIAVVLGLIMVSTHWGWVHVAEFSANAVHSRRNSEIETERFRWLHTLEPYTRYEVTTDVAEDGSLTLATVRHRPVPTTPGHFTYALEVVESERHPDDEPAALIAERAEHLRRQAALMTERERTRFQAVAEEKQLALMGRQDEAEQLRARRATSEALAEQIEANLKDAPLTEGESPPLTE